jgi:hypothetical protein
VTESATASPIWELAAIGNAPPRGSTAEPKCTTRSERSTERQESTYDNFDLYGRARPAETGLRTAVPGGLLTRKRSQVQTLSRPPARR